MKVNHRNIIQKNSLLLLGKSLQEEGTGERKILKLRKKGLQKVKKKILTGKQIETILITEMLIMIMIMNCLWK